jgi:sugar lactone lactonase YvrE
MRVHSALVLTATALTSACGSKPTAKPAAAEPPAASAPAPPPDVVEGFKQPESVKYDAGLDVWYVSNINGDPFAKDNNGFISRLKSDGSIDSLEFIAGGKNNVTLNGPKGMALVGDTLWVADIDAVRGFNRRTGAPVATVDLKGRARFLNDIAAAPDALYITDSGFGSDGKGGMGHPGPDQIFRVAEGKATLALKNSALAAPNGIAWDSAGGRFIIGPFAGKTMQAWAPGQKKLTALGDTPGQVDGIEVIGPDKILFTSWADSTLDLLQGGKVTPVAKQLASPADIGVDLKDGRVAIPQLMENKVAFRQLPAPTP